ncbi:MAG: hypothetical protein JXR96_18245 [Deltaproteobacteria bacterium]|nr:hypothetical protein [Deltaproteobacteria bacterium]
MRHSAPFLVLAGLLTLPAWAASGFEKPESVQQAALAMMDALKAGEQAQARELALDFAEWQSISLRGLDEQAHERKLARFLGTLAAWFKQGVVLERLDLKDVLILPRGRKTRRAVHMAVFHAELRGPGKGGEEIVPLLFVEVGGRWKLMLRD